jgi:hypothetical protein
VKVTGIILIVLGLVAGIVCVIQMVPPDAPGADAAVPGAGPERPNMTIPLAVCGAAIVIGGLLLMFGGRSYYESDNPRVRN